MQRQIDAIIDLALSEDIGPGDLTAESVIPETARADRADAAQVARRHFRPDRR